MTKNLFVPSEIKTKEGEFKLQLLHEFAKPVEETEVVEEPVYTGPTVEELQKEADDFKAKWEIEKNDMLARAQESADEIVKKAEEAAFAEVKRQTDRAQVIKTEAEQEADRIKQEAQAEAAKIIEKANGEREELLSASRQDGYNEGRDAGYKEGKAEVDRLVARTHKILEAVLARREEILSGTEQQVVELVILMARKVIKIISENQKNVVMANVAQALKKIRGRSDVTIRVNLEDVKLTTDHIQDFIHSVENVQGITVLEDSTVEKGGCVVETDFGSIDARISSQLSELEAKILEISPIKTIAKADTVAESI